MVIEHQYKDAMQEDKEGERAVQGVRLLLCAAADIKYVGRVGVPGGACKCTLGIYKHKALPTAYRWVVL